MQTIARLVRAKRRERVMDAEIKSPLATKTTLPARSQTREIKEKSNNRVAKKISHLSKRSHSAAGQLTNRDCWKQVKLTNMLHQELEFEQQRLNEMMLHLHAHQCGAKELLDALLSTPDGTPSTKTNLASQQNTDHSRKVSQPKVDEIPRNLNGCSKGSPSSAGSNDSSGPADIANIPQIHPDQNATNEPVVDPKFDPGKDQPEESTDNPNEILGKMRSYCDQFRVVRNIEAPSDGNIIRHIVRSRASKKKAAQDLASSSKAVRIVFKRRRKRNTKT